MIPNADDIEKFIKVLKDNLVGVIVGLALGCAITSWMYETFLLESTKSELAAAKEKLANMPKEKHTHELVPAAEDKREPLGIKFSIINQNEFLQGSEISEIGRHPDEGQFQSSINYDFKMSITEVTQGQFEKLMGYNPSKFRKGKNYPVDSVTWHESASFTNALSREKGEEPCYICTGQKENTNCKQKHNLIFQCKGFRLPTESEWELAARAGAKGRFWLGDDERDLAEVAWYEKNSPHSTQPVALLRANNNQLFDILGNVYEWVNDWYDEYPSNMRSDYTGPESGGDKVNRGGGYTSVAEYHRLANRAYDKPYHRQDHIGFRLAQSK